MPNIFVAVAGSDLTGDGTTGNRYATVAKALTDTVPGQPNNIIVGNGTYAQRIIVQGKVGTQANKITIKSENPLGAIITGVNNNLYNVSINDSDWIVLQDFDIRINRTVAQSADVGGDHAVILAGGSTHLRVTGCHITQLGDNPSDAALQANYTQGWRNNGISIRANVSFVEVDHCTVSGINKGISAIGAVDHLYYHDCTVLKPVQSGLHFGSGSTNFANNVIDDCLVDYSFMEDGLQTLPDGQFPDGTRLEHLGILVRRCVFRNNGENVIDTKAGMHVFIEDCVMYGTWGSNDGRLDTVTSTPNTGASNQIVCGANQITKHRVARNCISYNNNGGFTPHDQDSFYNNVLWYNRFNYTGTNATTDNVKFIALNCTEGEQIQKCVFRNNVLGRSFVGMGIRTHAGQSVDIDYNAYINNNNIGKNNTNGQLYNVVADWKAFIAARNWNLGTEQNGKFLATAAAALWVNVPENPTLDHDNYDFTTLDTSPLHQVGGHITTANGAGTNSTNFIVVNAYPFRDDWGRSDIGVTGDTIYIQGVGTRTIAAINWPAGAITLNAPATWANGAKVYFGDSATPNIGLLESSGVVEPPVVTGTAPVRIFRQASAVTPILQNIPLPGDLTEAPVAGRLYASVATANNTATAPASVSLGMFTTAEQVAIALRSANATPATSTNRNSSNADLALFVNPTTTAIQARGQKTSLSQATLGITWSVAPPAAYLMNIELLFGNAATIKFVAINPALNGAVPIVLTHPWKVCYSLSNGKPMNAGFATVRVSQGVAVKNGATITQNAWSLNANHSAATPTIGARLTPNMIGAICNSGGGLSWSTQLANPIGNNVDLVTRTAIPGDAEEIALLFIDTDVEVWTGIVALPGAVGVQPYTNPGFPVGALQVLGTLLTAVDANLTGGVASPWSMSTLTGQANFGMAYADKVGAPPTATQTIDDTAPIHLPIHSGANGVLVSAWAGLATGWQWTFDQAVAGQALVVAWPTSNVTLNIADVTFGALTIDAIAITQKHVMAIADVTFGALQVDSITISQTHMMAIVDVTFGALTIDAIAMTQHHVMAIADITFGALFIDAITLVQAGELGITDITFGALQIDTIAMTQHHVVAIADVTFGALEIEAIAISQTHTIAIADITFGALEVEAVAASQVHMLALTDITFGALEVEAVTITQHHELEIEDIEFGALEVEAVTIILYIASGLVRANFSVRKPTIRFTVGDE